MKKVFHVSMVWLIRVFLLRELITGFLMFAFPITFKEYQWDKDKTLNFFFFDWLEPSLLEM